MTDALPISRSPLVFPRKRRFGSIELSVLWGLVLCVGLLLLAPSSYAAPQVDVEALMPPTTAVLKIDGQRKMLKVGQTHKGVTLVSVYTRTAALEVDGKESVVGLSRKVGTNYQQPVERRVSIQRNQALQYRTSAQINGRQTEVMVDTGANIVAMNLGEAQRLGLKLKNADRVLVETASGQSNAWQVNLNHIDVGGIRVNNVQATVIEGAFPSVTLLGMTYLRHVKIEENQGIMVLIGQH